MSAKKTDAFAMPQFDLATVNESVREYSEKMMAQNTEAYGKLKVAAEEATASAQKGFDAVREGFTALSAKAVENTKVNTEAGVAHIEKLTAAKTFAEVVELQGAFFRNAFETMVAQAKEAQEMTVKFGEKAAAPAKAAAEKAMKAAA